MKTLLLATVLLGNSTSFGQEITSYEFERKAWGVNPQNSKPVCKVVGRARGIPEAAWDFNFEGNYDNYISKVQHCFSNEVLTSNRCLEEAVFYRSQDECRANFNSDLLKATIDSGTALANPMYGGVCSGGDRWWDFWGYGCFHLAKDMYYVATIGKLKQQLLEELSVRAAPRGTQGQTALAYFHTCAMASTVRSQIEQCYKTASGML